ncbi:MAG: PBP1A family penicillin-binding protein [Rickettsiales bacterium]|jgi:penicillin-binding protein 1A|nr:PBP1A family penicillin-binding protein [Rickettsiales bacterium]
MKFIDYTLRALFWIAVSVMVLAIALFLRYGTDLPEYKSLASYRPPVATRLYASDGSLLMEYATERRVFIEFQDLPPQLIDAFVAAEDSSFWSHSGIDFTGIARATGNNALRVLGGGTRFSGASTITQQVAKNFFLSSDRTISRKIREVILALRLERTFSKEHIMALYLNQIYLGARAFGVGSASLMYFNKPVSELSLSEMAYLAALPKAPNNYNPAKNMEGAISRRNWVLGRMLKEKMITAQQADAAMAEPLAINDDFTAQQADDFQYFSEEVRRRMINIFGREKLYNEGLYIKTTLDKKLQIAAQQILRKNLEAYHNAHPRDDSGGEDGKPEIQGALIAIHPHTGRVLAISGGYSFADSSFNRAVQARRQVGSTIKPFIYLNALERPNFTPQTLLLDAPVVSIKDDNTMWKPENYDRQFKGFVPLRQSLETSRNATTVRLVQDLGVHSVVNTAKKFGVYDSTLKNINLSVALGSGESTLENMTLAFSAFINGGFRHQSSLVDYVQDRSGRTIFRNADCADCAAEWKGGATPPSASSGSDPLSDPQSLYQLTSILTGVVERGTGRRAQIKGHAIAGKTGTTNEVKDVWFVGFTTNLAVGVYMGYDTPRPLADGSGSGLAAQIFREFMEIALDGQKGQPFPQPNGLEFVRVNYDTGTKPTGAANERIITEVFKIGQTPNPLGAKSNSLFSPDTPAVGAPSADIETGFF